MLNSYQPYEQIVAGKKMGTVRTIIREVFSKYWVSRRNEIETTLGLDWVYDMLKVKESEFTDIVKFGASADARREAFIFLSTLPFPGQWNLLSKFENNLENNKEIKDLLANEKSRIAHKLEKKKDKTFKLRHFCQILKKPISGNEKGVIRIFSLPYLFANQPLLKALNSKYFIFIEPPWGVLARHAWLRVFSTLDDPCLFGVGGHEDTLFLQTQENILTTHMAHGEFLNEGETGSLNAEKKYDIVFNSSFDEMPTKRHAFFLDVLADKSLRHIRTIFIGKGDEQNVSAFQNLVKEKNLENRITVKANLFRSEVPDILVQCRVGVHVSMHENACRCVYEYLRSNLPVIVTSSMAGFNFDTVNSKTGLVVTDDGLPQSILYVLNNIDKFTPRDWFLKNTGSSNSSRQLNSQLKFIFNRLGYRWTEDIVPLGSSGANRYMSLGDYEKFEREYRELYAILKKYAAMRIDLTIE